MTLTVLHRSMITSGGIHLRGLAPELNYSEETLRRWRAVVAAVPDFTVEIQTPDLPHRHDFNHYTNLAALKH